MKPQYYGQNEEDRYIEGYFSDNYVGNCIEVGGGNDGIKHSNTFYFENKGWNCLVIEAQPDFATNIRKYRKNVINAAINSSDAESIQFSIVYCNGIPWGGMSGLSVDERLVEMHRQMNFQIDLKKVTVPSSNLQRCAIEHFGKDGTIDFISIDTEGTELDVIKSIDLEQFKVKLIIAENNFGSTEIFDYLSSIGWKRDRVIQQNEFYTKK